MTELATILLEFKELPQLQADQFPHWAIRNRYRRHWHAQVGWALREQGWKARDPKTDPHFRKVLVECVRHSSSKPDEENLSNSFKPILDGLVQHGIVRDDNAHYMLRKYEWEQAEPNEGHISVRITGA